MAGLLGRKGRRGRAADRIASTVVENLKSLAKAYLAARRGAKTKARRGNIIRGNAQSSLIAEDLSPLP
jgi:hypothetical protein